MRIIMSRRNSLAPHAGASLSNEKKSRVYIDELLNISGFGASGHATKQIIWRVPAGRPPQLQPYPRSSTARMCRTLPTACATCALAKLHTCIITVHDVYKL